MDPSKGVSRFQQLPPSPPSITSLSTASPRADLSSSSTRSSTLSVLHVIPRKNTEPQLLSNRIAALCKEKDICGRAIANLRELLTKLVERDPIHEELSHLVRILALAPDMFSYQERGGILATGRMPPQSAGLTTIEDAIQRLDRLTSEVVGKPALVTHLTTLTAYYKDFCTRAKAGNDLRSLFQPMAQLATLEGDFYLITPSTARTILSLGEDGKIVNTSNSGQLHSVTPLGGIHFKVPGSTPIDFPTEVLVSSFYEQLDPGVKASAPTTLVVISNLPIWTLPGVNNVEERLENDPALYAATGLQMSKKGGVAQASFTIGYSTPEDKKAGCSKDAITLEDFLSANDIFSLLDRSFLESPSAWLTEWDFWKTPSPAIDCATCFAALSQWIPNLDPEQFPTIFKTAASPKRWKHLIDTLKALPDTIRARLLSGNEIARVVDTPRLFAIGFLARLRRIFSSNFPENALPKEFGARSLTLHDVDAGHYETNIRFVLQSLFVWFSIDEWMELAHVLESRPLNQETLMLFTRHASLTDLVRIPQTLRSLERLYPQHDPQTICIKFRTILDDIDKRSLCALIFGGFITRQRDGKPLNYMIEIDADQRRRAQSKEELQNSLVFRCIDNDDAAGGSYGGQGLPVIKTQLALLPGELLDSPISFEMREYFQSTEQRLFLEAEYRIPLAWLVAIDQCATKLTRLIHQGLLHAGNLMNSDREPMIGYPIMVSNNLFPEAAEDVRTLRLAMEAHPHLTIRDALVVLEPIISRVYQWTLGHDQDSWMLYSTLCRAPSVLDSSLTVLNPVYDPQGTFGSTIRIHGKDVSLKEYVLVQRGPQDSVPLQKAVSIFRLQWLPTQPGWSIKGAGGDTKRLRLLASLAKLSHTRALPIVRGISPYTIFQDAVRLAYPQIVQLALRSGIEQDGRGVDVNRTHPIKWLIGSENPKDKARQETAMLILGTQQFDLNAPDNVGESPFHALIIEPYSPFNQWLAEAMIEQKGDPDRIFHPERDDDLGWREESALARGVRKLVPGHNGLADCHDPRLVFWFFRQGYGESIDQTHAFQVEQRFLAQAFLPEMIIESFDALERANAVVALRRSLATMNVPAGPDSVHFRGLLSDDTYISVKGALPFNKDRVIDLKKEPYTVLSRHQKLVFQKDVPIQNLVVTTLYQVLSGYGVVPHDVLVYRHSTGRMLSVGIAARSQQELPLKSYPQQVNTERLHMMMLFELLVSYSTGDASNFAWIPSSRAHQYQVQRVDTGHPFDYHSNSVSILHCLDSCQQIIDPKTRTRFLSISLERIRRWLDLLVTLERKIPGNPQAHHPQDRLPPIEKIRFLKATFSQFIDRLLKIQDGLQDPGITMLRLIQSVDSEYGRALLDNWSASPSAEIRYAQMTRAFRRAAAHPQDNNFISCEEARRIIEQLIQDVSTLRRARNNTGVFATLTPSFQEKFLCQSGRIDSPVVIDVVTRNAHLYRTLNLSPFNNLTDAQLKQILQNTRNLAELNLKGCHALTINVFDDINAHCPFLRVLHAPENLAPLSEEPSSKSKKATSSKSKSRASSSAEPVVPAGTVQLTGSSLEKVTFDGCRQLLRLHITSLALTYLSLERCYGLQTVTLQTTKLVYFNAYDCWQLNRDSLDRLALNQQLETMKITGVRSIGQINNSALITLCPRLLFTRNSLLTREQTALLTELMKNSLEENKAESRNDWSEARLEMLAEALAMGKTCEELTLTHQQERPQPDARGLIRLLKVVQAHPSLHTFRLHSFHFDEFSFQALGDMIRKNRTLQILDISQCTFPSHLLKRFVDVLIENPFIHDILLADCGLQAKDAKELARLVQNARHLAFFAIGNNNLGDEGIRLVAGAIRSSSLRFLQVNNTSMTNIGMMELLNVVHTRREIRIDVGNNTAVTTTHDLHAQFGPVSLRRAYDTRRIKVSSRELASLAAFKAELHRLIECHCPPTQTIHDPTLNRWRDHLLEMIQKEDNLIPHEQREQLMHAARELFIRSALGQEQKSLPEIIQQGLLSSTTIGEIQIFLEQLMITYDSILSHNQPLKVALEAVKATSFQFSDNHPDATLLRELVAEITAIFIEGELGRTRVTQTVSLTKLAEKQLGDFNAPDFAIRLDRFMNRYLAGLNLPELDSLGELLRNMQFSELKTAARELFFRGPHCLREVSVDISWVARDLLNQRESSTSFEQSLQTVIQDNHLSTQGSVQPLMRKLDTYMDEKQRYQQKMTRITSEIITYTQVSAVIAQATVPQPSTLAKLALAILDSF